MPTAIKPRTYKDKAFKLGHTPTTDNIADWAMELLGDYHHWADNKWPMQEFFDAPEELLYDLESLVKFMGKLQRMHCGVDPEGIPEAIEALDWVRDQGGLEEVKKASSYGRGYAEAAKECAEIARDAVVRMEDIA